MENKIRLKKYFFLLIIFFSLAKSSVAMVFPGTDWQEATPESQGVDSAKLQEAIDFVEANSLGSKTTEMMVIRNGYVLWQGSNVNTFHKLYSAGKTFSGAAAGILVMEGKLNIEEYGKNYYPLLDSKYDRAKIKHFLTMTSGYDFCNDQCGQKDITACWSGNPVAFGTNACGNDCSQTGITGCWSGNFIYGSVLPPIFQPGSTFWYNNPNIEMLDRILDHITGMNLANYFKLRIANPLGMASYNTAYEMSTTASDMARFGLFFLNRGNWNGQRLINADFIDQATTSQVPVSLGYKNFDGRGRYGYFWWTNGIMASGKRMWPSAPAKTYSAHGAGHNFCFVIPEWNMVIVRLESDPEQVLSSNSSYNWSINELFWNEFFSRLAPGVNETDTAPPEAPTGLEVR